MANWGSSRTGGSAFGTTNNEMQRLEGKQTKKWRELRTEYNNTTAPKKVTDTDLTKGQREYYYEAKNSYEDDGNIDILKNASPKTIKAVFQRANYDNYEALKRAQAKSPNVSDYEFRTVKSKSSKTDFQNAVDEYERKRKFTNAIAVLASDRNIDISTNREITSSTYNRATRNITKQINERFKGRR